MSEQDAKMTPMMRQYFDIKKDHHDEILFFRMGDFYEMFFDDARVASRILDIALTSRQNEVPMCGVPYHAADNYIARLVRAGKNVAICEQLEKTPSAGATIVRREVTRIITPGTVIEANLLPSDDNNFLCSLVTDTASASLSFADLSTGDFHLSTVPLTIDDIRSEITRYRPGEIVFRDTDTAASAEIRAALAAMGIPINRISDWFYDTDYLLGLIRETWEIHSERGLGISGELEIRSVGSAIQYLKETQRQAVHFLKFPKKTDAGKVMKLDEATITNLEIVTNLHDGSRDRTLFAVLNKTRTAMGRRFLERALLEPLTDREAISGRHDIVAFFTEYQELSRSLRESLARINDLERLVSRFTLARIVPRNFIALAESLRASRDIRDTLVSQPHDASARLGDTIPDLTPLADMILATIDDEPALTPEAGRVIRPGKNSEIDRLHGIRTEGKNWIITYQEEEKSRLNSPTLKIRYNRILGYYIEMSKAQAEKAPDDYLRKQTLVGAERFTTEKLQSFERDILSASDRIIELELQELTDLQNLAASHTADIQRCAEAIALIDFYQSMATAALENRYLRPEITGDGALLVTDGRHPVVEKFFTGDRFIPNNINLDTGESMIKIITGPNMSGKSTYIRMTAIIQLMAQAGSFIPASQGRCPVVDRIFTRIGASDNISRGESTFLVEMNETAAILNSATSKSLIIMDEVGRGTSTFDGLSIAWAIVEYILRYIGAKTLFATHYHELTELGGQKGIENYTVQVRETVQGIEFLHKVIKGSADRSYGIHVAKIAGIPKQIINRADSLLKKLESREHGKKVSGVKDNSGGGEQLEIFNAANHRLVQALRGIDLDNLKPVDALVELSRLRKIVDGS